jgi:hypothetical protein
MFSCGTGHDDDPEPVSSMCDALDTATCEETPGCAVVDFVETRLHLGGNWSWRGPNPRCFEGAEADDTERTVIWKSYDAGGGYGFILGGPVPVGWYPCPHEEDPLPEQCELATWASTMDVDEGETG